jgi:hypothetical protein
VVFSQVRNCSRQRGGRLERGAHGSTFGAWTVKKISHVIMPIFRTTNLTDRRVRKKLRPRRSGLQKVNRAFRPVVQQSGLSSSSVASFSSSSRRAAASLAAMSRHNELVFFSPLSVFGVDEEAEAAFAGFSLYASEVWQTQLSGWNLQAE